MAQHLEEIKQFLQANSFTKDVIDFLARGKVFVINDKKHVEKELETVFATVQTTFPKHLHNPVLYLLGELTDNINQHSQYSEGFVVLDYEKTTKTVHFMIFDDGITIPGGFERNAVSFKDDLDAVKMAMRGKSTKKEEGRGFGLSTSKKLVEEGFKGKFVVVSRRGLYTTENSVIQKQPVITGTLVYATFFDKGEALNIYEYLE